MAHFKRVTCEAPSQTSNAVVMGRKTWESIPERFRPLPGRLNVVLSRNQDKFVPEGVLQSSSLQNAVEQLEKREDIATIFVIGGSQIYQQALDSGLVKKVVYTEVAGTENLKFDAFFPELPESEWERSAYSTDKENGSGDEMQRDSKSGLEYRFLEFTRKPINKEEIQYLDMCRNILENGVKRGDRTGTGTLSQFGTQMRFSLRDGTLPLLTTKRVFWRGVAEELLWFVSVRTTCTTHSSSRYRSANIFG